MDVDLGRVELDDAIQPVRKINTNDSNNLTIVRNKFEKDIFSPF